MASASDYAISYEMSAYGKLARFLSSKTFDKGVISPFRETIVKHSQNVLEPILITSSSKTPAFGATEVHFEPPQQADILGQLYAQVTLPGIGKVFTASDSTRTWATNAQGAPHWHPNAGQRVINEIRLQFGGTRVTSMDYLQIHIWQHVRGTPEKLHPDQVGAPELGAELDLQSNSKRQQVMIVPIPFWFTESTYVHLPLSASIASAPKFVLSFASLADMICHPTTSTTGGSVATTVYLRPDEQADADVAASPTPIAASDLTFNLDSICYIVEEQERNNFVEGHFNHLFTHWQPAITAHLTSSASSTPQEVSLDGFGLAGRELLFTCRRQDVLDNTLSSGATNPYKNHYNFWGYYDVVAEKYIAPVNTFAYKVANSYRVQTRPGEMFWWGMNHAKHSNVPRVPIYCVPFGYDLEGTNSHGSASMADMDQKKGAVLLRAKCFTAIPTDSFTGSVSNATMQVDFQLRAYSAIHFDAGRGTVRFA